MLSPYVIGGIWISIVEEGLFTKMSGALSAPDISG